jgi:hypothetical protein
MPLHLPGAEGPHHPVGGTPRRAPGSARRTSTIDTARPDGPLGQMVMSGHARDLITLPDAATREEHARITAFVDGPSRELVSITAEPDPGGLDALIGVVVGPGFRARVDTAVPAERTARSLLYLLLDDLPGAGLVSGYALLNTDTAPRGRHNEYLAAAADMCAGWASDGSMMQAIREHGRNPSPTGPPAPSLDRPEDALAYHQLPPLPPGGMRRLRRIDVTPSDGRAGNWDLDVFFRDSHMDDALLETVVHEYSLSARVAGPDRTIGEIDVTADVLPWKECPAAVASAVRLVGHGLDDLRSHVRSQFVGTTTCTHLNDVLRGLTDVDVLIDALVPAVGSSASGTRA